MVKIGDVSPKGNCTGLGCGLEDTWVFHHPSCKWFSVESQMCWLPPKDNLPRERNGLEAQVHSMGPRHGWEALPSMQYHRKWRILSPAWGCLQGRAQKKNVSACSSRGSLRFVFPWKKEKIMVLYQFSDHIITTLLSCLFNVKWCQTVRLASFNLWI